MKTMKGYHDLYLKCKALLLADVFQKFKNNSLKSYGLRRGYYLSAPIFKMTKVVLVLISDPDMHIFSEKCTRSVISYISNRYSIANNKYLKSYDQKQESKHVIYLGRNNSCEYAMPMFLPTSGFKWIDPKEILKI